jgi:hypothetical protein
MLSTHLIYCIRNPVYISFLPCKTSRVPPPLQLSQLPALPSLLAINPPETRKNAQNTRHKRNIIRRAIAPNPHLAAPLPIRLNHGIRIIRRAIKQVIHVPANHRRKRHKSPIHRKPIRPKRIDHERGENAEQDAVRKAREPRDGPEVVRVRDVDGADLREGEDGCGDCGAPEARVVQALDDEVGADA